ncbi:DUF6503 family protein [Robiginitalea marina]|uniref:DUF6503 family protein n=1 Tax=Robiginitalea marina TaxID=2954105 RepID=A0ABT1AWD7_9FLAO|nr:DUF6503 family protein [Robiginitalea marina]MCO5724369.1 DUF6503 family protein [Robiginitalea marina]
MALPKPLLIVLLTGLGFLPCEAQSLPASEILGKSIRHHDPNGVWGRYRGSFAVLLETPGEAPRTSKIRMDQPASRFRLEMTRGEVAKVYELAGDSCSLQYNGTPQFSEEIANKHRLTCDAARMYKNYYSFLYGLPMKLRDPGTHLSPEAQRVTFHGKSYWVVEVRYDPEVGKDLWHFYFNPDTFALEAYQFYHDKALNDGEYILLEGEHPVGGMLLPKNRSWYTNLEDKFLGTDILQDF